MTADVSTLTGATDVESLDAHAVVGLMVERLHPRLALACSFQKEEAVLIDILLEQQPDAAVFAIDTHVLFPETYAVWRAIERRYGIEVQAVEGPSLGRQAAAHGDALWERNPSLCCAIRKVGPLGAALSGLDGWITGVRRDQSPTRAGTPKIGWDERHELWKAAPLADWSDADVWAYIEKRDLPVNELHARGYASIGCVHCTAPGTGREGRWAGTDKTECGLHA
ncbi:MAG: phosphoadenylyl-sulfate reductase [Actinobacteria bacterium]|nr:phosphoadenylyl-sulfate reductase [Actinomycetota bacterium]